MVEFWTIVETNTAIRVPKYLKNILMLNGYDDALSIESITTKDIDLFEEFGKNEIDSFVGVNDDPKDFYHIFCDKKDKFQIMKGDRVKLMDVVEFVRKKLASEAGHNFFKEEEETIQRTSNKSLNPQNYKQIYENHRIDIKDYPKMTPKFLKPSSNVEVFTEIKRQNEMVAPFLMTKHEHIDSQNNADLSQTLPSSSTGDPLTVHLSPPSNAELASLTHEINRIPPQFTSNIDVNVTSVSSIHVGQYSEVDDDSESDVSSFVSAQLQNIPFGKNQQTNIGKNYACDVCKKLFGRRVLLKRHQIVHTGQKDYACGVCQKTFGQSSNLKRHQKIHSGSEKPYVCDVCQLAFTEKSTLQVHQRLHSGKKPYVCDVCERAFSQSSSLLSHKRTHTGEKPYVCDVCERAFSQSSSLFNHKRIHTGQKPYVCQKAFGQGGNLNRHQRIHSDRSEVCQRAFKDASSLKRHQTIHSDKKPHGGDDVCQQAYNLRSTSSRQLRIHNDDKEEYSCAHCGKSYKRKFNLKTHLKKHNFEDHFEDH